jgi:hypothetical protein
MWRTALLLLVAAAAVPAERLENGRLRVDVTSDASVVITDKRTGVKWRLEPPGVLAARMLPAQPLGPIERRGGSIVFTGRRGVHFELRLQAAALEYSCTPEADVREVWLLHSLQTSYTLHPKSGLSLLVNYTFSKYLSSMAYADPYANVLEKGLNDADQPHVFKLTAVYQFPFGRGKRFGGGSSRLRDALIGGWEWSNMFGARSGEPANLPGNVRILKNPKLENVEWRSNQVVGWSPCVLRMDNSGNIAPQQYSLAKGCGTNFAAYSWLVLPSYAPGETPLRSGQIRTRRAVTLDGSLIKNFSIGERLRAQFGAEVFNLLNHFILPMAQVNSNPNDANFGTLFPAQQDIVTTGTPRVIQLRFKLMW